MKKYQSHKVVEAAQITDVVPLSDKGLSGPCRLMTGPDVLDFVDVDHNWMAKNCIIPDKQLIGGYVVRYAGDGYLSWSPAGAFEGGYVELTHDPKNGALPVAGYKPQTDAKVQVVNGFKADEERILRKLDALAEKTSEPSVDGRWLAIGRTALEQAFMAINRAVFQPGRVELPPETANLGLATNREIEAEMTARARLGFNALDYRTVDV